MWGQSLYVLSSYIKKHCVDTNVRETLKQEVKIRHSFPLGHSGLPLGRRKKSIDLMYAMAKSALWQLHIAATHAKSTRQWSQRNHSVVGWRSQRCQRKAKRFYWNQDHFKNFFGASCLSEWESRPGKRYGNTGIRLFTSIRSGDLRRFMGPRVWSKGGWLIVSQG